jgi:hypothetical protein
MSAAGRDIGRPSCPLVHLPPAQIGQPPPAGERLGQDDGSSRFPPLGEAANPPATQRRRQRIGGLQQGLDRDALVGGLLEQRAYASVREVGSQRDTLHQVIEHAVRQGVVELTVASQRILRRAERSIGFPGQVEAELDTRIPHRPVGPYLGDEHVGGIDIPQRESLGRGAIDRPAQHTVGEGAEREEPRDPRATQRVVGVGQDRSQQHAGQLPGDDTDPQDGPEGILRRCAHAARRSLLEDRVGR